ncbi:MAG TPA: hypothetical protein VFT55_11530 [Planctomycetota bacterium]|nr:hypothetical protein [Planctomycetota bacterium]
MVSGNRGGFRDARHPLTRRLRSLGASIAAAFLPFGSCTYLQQRLDDLHDSVLYRWHEGAFGLAVEAKLGPLEAGLGGWYADWGWGKDTWWQQPGYVLTNHGTGVPFTTLSPLIYDASWTRVFATSSSGSHPTAPDQFDDVRSWVGISDVFDLDDTMPFQLSTRQRIADAFGIEVGVVPLVTGLRVGFNAAEFADFVLGLVGIDVLGDDGRPRPPSLPFVPVK